MRPLRGSSTLCAAAALTVLGQAPSTARAEHLADHLVISEVAFDTTNETQPNSSEYIEIFNPTGQTITLNAGAEPGTSKPGSGSYFLADFFRNVISSTNKSYYEVVGGAVVLNSSFLSDSILQFPLNATIPPRGTVVIAADATTFLSEFFGGSLADFKALPGSPQLFESRQGGHADVADMVLRTSYGGSTFQTMSLTNGGEVAILFYWDGSSDTVKDVDIHLWKSSGATDVVKKTTATCVDGPDTGTETTCYANDAGQVSSLDTTSSSNNIAGPQRRNIQEPSEADSGGNGLTGQDESSEAYGLVATAANPTWVYRGFTPGMPLLQADGPISDALSWLAPIAVSAADGPGNGTDYGEDGTLTELYAWPIDSGDVDFKVDTLYIAVRGSLFGASNNVTSNASLVLIDFDPTQATGYHSLISSGNQLSDTTGAFDSRLTRASLSLAQGSRATMGFDGAMGLDAPTVSLDSAGWRTFGTGGTSGSATDFAYIDTNADVAFGTHSTLFGKATSASYAAPDGFEGLKKLSVLTSSASPTWIWMVAATTADAGDAASSNTVPESSQVSLSGTQTLDYGVCFNTVTGASYVKFRDTDGDGVGGAAWCGATDGVTLVDVPGDCNDGNAAVKPGATEVCDDQDNDCDGQVDEGQLSTYYLDLDDDGYGDPASSTIRCTAPEGYVDDNTDCDDTNPAANPAEEEVCDGEDNDCNAQVDEGLPTATYYTDSDADTYGTGSGTTTCEVLPGKATRAGDCNDNDAQVNPGKTETCDGKDNDCDSQVDEGVKTTWYIDADGDTYGGATTTQACTRPTGYTNQGGDCADNDATSYPGGTEVCDGRDNNCTGGIDEGVTKTFYADTDQDGVGGSSTTTGCTAPEGYVSAGGDCNDNDAAVAPGKTEVCDTKDNDCDSQTDEGVTTTYYKDNDADGTGGSTTTQACSAPSGYVSTGGDCNDNDPAVAPGKSEVCDTKDNNCDGQVPAEEQDSDNDAVRTCDGDCDDEDPSVKPGAAEICDGKDNDCDPSTLDSPDRDLDGVTTCGGDCDDTNPDINPEQPELCNEGVDDDCDPETVETEDGDGDGQTLCGGDCDDSDDVIFSQASEALCDDGTDDDCDGAADEEDDDCDEATATEGTTTPAPTEGEGTPNTTPGEGTPEPTHGGGTPEPTASEGTEPETAGPTADEGTEPETAGPTTAEGTEHETAEPTTAEGTEPQTAEPTTAEGTEPQTAEPTTAEGTDEPTGGEASEPPPTAAPTDGEVTAPPATATPAASPTEPGGDDGSCACSSSEPSSGVFSAAVFLLTLLVARRRR